MKIWYLPLEPYAERYTLQLKDWTEKRFEKRGVSFETILGQQTENTITTGRVLDAHGRCLWALTQMAALVEKLRAGEVDKNDVIFLHDLFHPGFEALPYILQQQFPHKRPRVYAQNWAQSVDVYDFTHAMKSWMRPYEKMCDRVLSGVFVASKEHARLLQAAGLDSIPIHVTGLPFDLDDVQERAGVIPMWKDRTKRVLFSSRWDGEKQPLFFIEVAKLARRHETLKEYSFTVCSSAPELRSNNPKLIHAAREAEAEGWIHIITGASKQEYYILLKDSRVHFNCALQDWVSFTMLEASALSTPTVAPCFRSFPDELPASQLYKPWDGYDALKTIAGVVNDDGQTYRHWFDNVAQRHDYSLGSVIAILTGEA